MPTIPRVPLDLPELMAQLQGLIESAGTDKMSVFVTIAGVAQPAKIVGTQLITFHDPGETNRDVNIQVELMRST